MFKSIRSRLVLSFAAIALVAAVALGAVLLTILKNYYSNLELAYLQGNAKAISGFLMEMISGNVSHEEVQSQIENLAFLTQTRIQVDDPNGQPLYDSGSPQDIGVNLGVMKQLLAKTNDAGPLSGDMLRIISVVPKSGSTTISAEPNNNPNPASPDVKTFPGSGTNGNTVTFAYRSVQAGGSPFGFYLNGEAVSGGTRSQQAVAMPVFDPQNSKKLGSVVLSEGPAYGSDILASVARGWALASVIGVLLAAAIGWYISRRISAPVLALTAVTTRMAEGDLSSRADVNSRDELGQLARSYNEMADQVEATVSTLRRFVSDAAHELRTPLTALRTNLDLALDENGQTDRAVFLARAQGMVKRLEELDTNLLDLSRLEANGHAASEAVVDMRELLQQRSEIYASQAEQAGLAYETELSVSPIPVRGDAGQIRRAMDNLVDNACKFTPPDGRVQVTLSQAEGWAIFSVEDTGIGIPADDLPQLFNRFHRGRNTMAYPGSGLGLAIVQAIVSKHKGRVEVLSSGEGKGSKFIFKVPAVSPQKP